MHIVISSRVVVDGQLVHHVTKLKIEEIIESSQNQDGEDSSEDSFIGCLLPGSEGWRCAEEIHAPDGVLYEVFESHFPIEIMYRTNVKVNLNIS